MANRQLLEASRLPPGSTITVLELLTSPPDTSESWLSIWFQGRKSGYRQYPLQEGAEVYFQGDVVQFTRANGQSVREKWILSVLPLNWKHPIVQRAWLNNEAMYQIVDRQVMFQGFEGPTRLDLSDLQSAFRAKRITKCRFWLGTDTLGRDILSRLIIGSRVSIGISLLAMLLSLLLGVTIGLLTGYFGGWMDTVLMGLANILWALPSLVLALALAFVFGRGLWQLLVSIGLSIWVDLARVVRSETRSLRGRPFVEVTQVMAFPVWRTLLYHVLPNLWGTIRILALANLVTAILLEAGLSFLGLGVSPPMPSWGGMVQESYPYLLFDKGFTMALFPGLAIVLLIFSLNLALEHFKEMNLKQP